MFSSLALNVPSDVHFNGHLVYGLNKVSFLVTQANFTGDFDVDGDVDSADLITWMNASKAGGLGSAGDADGDLDADGADFLIWQRQLGRRVAKLPASGGLGGVGGVGGVGGGVIRNTPEPGSIFLALGALAVTATIRRRPQSTPLA
jgi:hypothetical protein